MCPIFPIIQSPNCFQINLFISYSSKNVGLVMINIYIRAEEHFSLAVVCFHYLLLNILQKSNKMFTSQALYQTRTVIKRHVTVTPAPK